MERQTLYDRWQLGTHLDLLTAQLEAVEGGYRVDVRATSFARDVAVPADRVAPDAVVKEKLVPMLAGPMVLRTANGLCAPMVRS
jgi:beta-mannosidase